MAKLVRFSEIWKIANRRRKISKSEIFAKLPAAGENIEHFLSQYCVPLLEHFLIRVNMKLQMMKIARRRRKFGKFSPIFLASLLIFF